MAHITSEIRLENLSFIEDIEDEEVLNVLQGVRSRAGSEYVVQTVTSSHCSRASTFDTEDHEIPSVVAIIPDSITTQSDGGSSYFDYDATKPETMEQDYHAENPTAGRPGKRGSPLFCGGQNTIQSCGDTKSPWYTHKWVPRTGCLESFIIPRDIKGEMMKQYSRCVDDRTTVYPAAGTRTSKANWTPSALKNGTFSKRQVHERLRNVAKEQDFNSTMPKHRPKGLHDAANQRIRNLRELMPTLSLFEKIHDFLIADHPTKPQRRAVADLLKRVDGRVDPGGHAGFVSDTTLPTPDASSLLAKMQGVSDKILKEAEPLLNGRMFRATTKQEDLTVVDWTWDEGTSLVDSLSLENSIATSDGEILPPISSFIEYDDQKPQGMSGIIRSFVGFNNGASGKAHAFPARRAASSITTPHGLDDGSTLTHDFTRSEKDPTRMRVDHSTQKVHPSSPEHVLADLGSFEATQDNDILSLNDTRRGTQHSRPEEPEAHSRTTQSDYKLRNPHVERSAIEVTDFVFNSTRSCPRSKAVTHAGEGEVTSSVTPRKAKRKLMRKIGHFLKRS